jgi:hypothetical protein
MSLPLALDELQSKRWLGPDRELLQKSALRCAGVGTFLHRRDSAGQPMLEIMDSITATSEGLFNSQN